MGQTAHITIDQGVGPQRHAADIDLNAAGAAVKLDLSVRAGIIWHRAVYYDERYPSVWASGTWMLDHLVRQGYTVLDADVLINVPIAKDHSLARLTLGMKNLLGVVHHRNQFHVNLGQRIADLTTVVQPSLTVVDAVRILVDHGPSSGNLDDVKLTNTVIASHDIVAADAYAATLFGFSGKDIPATRIGAEMGLGTLDLDSVKVEEISV